MKLYTTAKCPECWRIFDLLDEDDANEWHYGHDCEPAPRQFETEVSDG